MRSILLGPAGIAFAAFFALCGAALPVARAQQPAPSITVNQVDAGKYPDVRAIVNVLDARGVPVAGLTAAQFQAFDAEAAVPVSAVQNAQDASQRLSVVVTIDVSGSMAGQPLDQAKQAATAFIGSLAPDDQAALIAFGPAVTTVVPFTADRARLTAGIAALSAGGGTALWEAVQTSAAAATSAPTPRRAIVLLTDGVNDSGGSQASAAGSLAAAQAAGAPTFTIGFGADPDVAYLQALSGATQGQYRAATAADVGAVYADIATLLRSQYVLTIRAAAPADGKGASLRIVATVGGAQASASAPFTRGSAPPAPVATQPAASQGPAAEPGGGTSVAPIAFGGIVALVVVALLAFFFVRWQQRRRLLREQLAIVAPNPALAAALGVPRPPGGDTGRGSEATWARIVSLNGATGDVASFELSPIPISIGSGSECNVRLPASDDVAPRHALVWAKDGKIMLRHVGGRRRATVAAGRPVDWVILDEGDEFSLGGHRFRAGRTQR